MNPAPPVTNTLIRSPLHIRDLPVRHRFPISFARADEDCSYGLDQNLEVQGGTPIANVTQVHPHPFIEILHVISPIYLPQTSHSRLDRELLFLMVIELGIFTEQWRPWTDQAHVSLQYTVELRKFIQAVPPHPTSELCHARIIRQLEYRSVHLVKGLKLGLDFICIGTHGTKLIPNKGLAILSHDAPLVEQRAA